MNTNNLTIEQMREIVSGAPEHAERWLNGMYLKQGEWTWWWSGYVSKWLQFEKHIYSNSKFEIAIDLNDLRTAIAKHDSREFKVGDLVVYRKQCSLIWDGVYRVDAVLADGRVIERDLPTPKEWLSHATPEEIKAGLRGEYELI